jgi:CheY-like chemotaxis protein
VHRDVKPGNILLDRDRCYVTDFGLTRRIGSGTAVTSHGDFVGTIEYVAPEQIEGKPLDRRADVYSFGCILYETLAGTPPYERESAVSIMYAHLRDRPPPLCDRDIGLPPEIDDVIATALAKRPEDRYPGCRELVAAAASALGIEGAPPAASAGPPARTRTIVVATADAGIGALVRVVVAEAGAPFPVQEAVDAAGAVELARHDRPDAILLDWALSGATPAEVCAALQSATAARDVPIVVLAPRSEHVGSDEIAAAGARVLLRRPFSSLQLLNVLSDVLDADLSAA